MRVTLLALFVVLVLLAGCGGQAGCDRAVTYCGPGAGTQGVSPIPAPAIVAETATVDPTPPPPTVSPAVPMTADESYLVGAVQGQMGEADGLLSWLDGYDRGTTGAAQLEQQAIGESAALKAQTQRILVALQPVTDADYRCFGRIAVDGTTTDTVAVANLANLAAIRLSGGQGATEARRTFSTTLASAWLIEDALRKSIAGLAQGTPLPAAVDQAKVLVGAPFGGIARTLGCPN